MYLLGRRCHIAFQSAKACLLRPSVLAGPAGAAQTLGVGASGGKFHPCGSQTQSKDIPLKCFLSFAHVDAFLPESSQRF